ncbi:unnamed protein product [Trifolium pratense]|uniref:Uncharacterized protein n=1 Tax=Trifolium pratense TaxID=57577 RepID=A0ACB0KMG9_TRIPR|nr:unnamed protein product [Trifolium pratense]
MIAVIRPEYLSVFQNNTPTSTYVKNHNQIAFTAVDDTEGIAYGSKIRELGCWCSYLVYAMHKVLIMLEGNVVNIEMADLMNSELAEKLID